MRKSLVRASTLRPGRCFISSTSMTARSGEVRCVLTARSRFLAFVIGGLLDGYRDSITDMLQQTKAPLKAIVGPWNHTFPHDAVPGPQIEWRERGGPLVGLLAEGPGHRRIARSEADHLYAALASSGSDSGERSRRMAARRWLAAARCARNRLLSPAEPHLETSAPRGGRSSTQIHSLRSAWNPDSGGANC